MKTLLKKYLHGKKLLILGFGREGRSSYRLIRNYFPEMKIAIADRTETIELPEPSERKNTILHHGKDYLRHITDYDVIFKSPGVLLHEEIFKEIRGRIVTQTDLFLEKYAGKTVGITGTKGKSTTAGLISHILQTAGRKPVFAGNIGIPVFDVLEKIGDDTPVVFELSAHQLQQIHHAPHISVLLNIFTEHLDYFGSFKNYFKAKLNAGKFQNNNDYFLYNRDDLQDFDKSITAFRSKKISFSLTGGGKDFLYYQNEKLICNQPGIAPVDVAGRTLKGRHNLKNLLAVASVCLLLGVDSSEISHGITTFRPLAHRLEPAGEFAGIRFVNDSISTIPQSTVEALKSVKETDTLILGGFDRGIDFSPLVDYLTLHPVSNILLTGPAGLRMMKLLEKNTAGKSRILFFEDYAALPDLILKYTAKGKYCLLSPAASSYDRFNDFEERGNLFKKLVASLEDQPAPL